MKQQLGLAVALLVAAFAFPSDNLAGSTDEARANLHQINKSGVKAKIVLLESDDQVVVSGIARGLDPEAGYITLAYDPGSMPSGPNACRPTAGAPGFVGQWTVGPDGSGVLTASLPAGAIDGIGTMSIRLASTMALQACGDVDVEN